MGYVGRKHRLCTAEFNLIKTNGNFGVILYFYSNRFKIVACYLVGGRSKVPVGCWDSFIILYFFKQNISTINHLWKVPKIIFFRQKHYQPKFFPVSLTDGP